MPQGPWKNRVVWILVNWNPIALMYLAGPLTLRWKVGRQKIFSRWYFWRIQKVGRHKKYRYSGWNFCLGKHKGLSTLNLNAEWPIISDPGVSDFFDPFLFLADVIRLSKDITKIIFWGAPTPYSGPGGAYFPKILKKQSSSTASKMLAPSRILNLTTQVAWNWPNYLILRFRVCHLENWPSTASPNIGDFQSCII